MEIHQPNDLKTSLNMQSSEFKAGGAAPAAKNVTGDEQSDQLGSLAQIVMRTLGLSVEEARQMADDLGFLKF